MFNNYNDNVAYQNSMPSPQDVVKFLATIGKIVFELNEDWDFWSENNRALSTNDLFSPIRRLGRTEERYKKEIDVYNAILTAKDLVYPPKPQRQPYNHFLDPYYNPTTVEYTKHRNALAWHTDNIPIYVAIRYGKEGIDWVLDKFGEEVKRCYYSRFHQ